MTIQLLYNLFNKLGILILFAFILSKSKIFKNYILKEKLTVTNKIVLAIILGGIGILATYTGIPVNGGIANSRSICVIVAGLFGGPSVGILAGLIAGIHRMLLPTGRFTAIVCGISTIAGGAMAGFAKKKIDSSNNKWLATTLLAFFIDSIQMGIILLFAKPFDTALELIQVIFIPMTFINSLGTGAFMLMLEQIYNEHERAGALKAQLALNIASKTLPILRKGLDYESALQAAQIIYDYTEFDAVAFTDCKIILAHIGLGNDHHIKGRAVHTELTNKVIETGKYSIAQNKKDINCSTISCNLKSAIIIPLKMKDVIIGTLKLYKKSEQSISKSDIELAKGLGELFSTQLELSQIEHQKNMLQKAEFKALQAQIQPHFLFNALNTIIFFCRTNPLKARELLVKLSFYLRSSFKTNEEFVSFEQELKHIESYLSIEQARFSDRLSVEYKIDSSIDCMIPALLLQPIVENALKHGLREKKENGKLMIEAKKAEHNIIINIIDNGIGMTKEQIEAIFNKTDSHEGIGITNVNERLKSIFGTDLNVESRVNEGTKVTIYIPIKEAR